MSDKAGSVVFAVKRALEVSGDDTYWRTFTLHRESWFAQSEYGAHRRDSMIMGCRSFRDSAMMISTFGGGNEDQD